MKKSNTLSFILTSSMALLSLVSLSALADSNLTHNKKQTAAVKPVVALSGGINFININQSYTTNYTTPSGPTVYTTDWNGSAKNTQGMAGLFLGLELPFSIKEYPLAWQFGLAYYTDFSPYKISGNTKQGFGSIYPAYAYNYSIRSNQILFDNKLLMTFSEHYHPYFSVGLGMAINRAYDYQTIDNNPDNNPFSFANNTNNSFAYTVGLGLDMDVKFIPHLKGLRAGLGYRYVDFGTASLGRPITNSFSIEAPDALRLKQSLSAHQILAQLTYVF
jgi:opacity protein-like surface antigen